MANPANSTAYRLPDGRLAVNVTEAKTLAAEDSGYVQNVIGSSVVVTAPATATVGIWTVRNGGIPVTSGPAGSGDDGSAITVDCNGSDTLAGLDKEGTEADGKYLINTAATAQVGDEMTIINVGATNGGVIHAVRGTWTREG